MGKLIDIFLHLDVYLNQGAQTLGGWLYAILFAVIFCETGLVVTPFLPGDSLLFAMGALAASDLVMDDGTVMPSPINLGLLLVLLILAAIIGDATNYAIGRIIGPRVFKREDSWLLNKKHLERTQLFYEKHGGQTIIIARFVPIIRTFAPFVAGVGRMRYRRFATFNVVGAILWVTMFLVLGYLFGNLPVVKKYFQLVVIGIVLVSLLPILFEVLRARRERKAAALAAASASSASSASTEATDDAAPDPDAATDAKRTGEDAAGADGEERG